MTVLITGGARRLGKVIALALAKEGYDIIIHYNKSKNKALLLKEEIQSLGQKAFLIQADLSNPTATHRVFDQIKLMGVEKVDVFIHNASPFIYDDILKYQDTLYNQHMNVILQASLILSHYFSKQDFFDNSDKNQKEPSSNIINIIDGKTINPDARFLSYTLAKIALEASTKILAKTLAPKIRVNAVSPGPCIVAPHQTPSDFNTMCEKSLLRKPVYSQDIAQGILFILKNSSITGAILKIDCGYN